MKQTKLLLLAAVLAIMAAAPSHGFEPGAKPAATSAKVSTMADSTNSRVAQPAPAAKGIDSVAITPWEVMSDLGTEASSSLYRLTGTGGQTATGLSFEGCLADFHGFWQNFGDPCCRGQRGNADWDPDDLVDLSDLTTMVDWLFYVCSTILYCREEADLVVDGVIDISDLSALVDYLFGLSQEPLPLCP